MILRVFIEGSLEVKLPTIWTGSEESEKRREEKKREDQRRERVRRKKVQVQEKVEKSRFTVFFQWFVAPEGRKVGSLKRRVASEKAKTPHVRSAFGSCDVKEGHAVVARSTFRSQTC